MKELLTPDSFAAEIRMLRSTFDGAFVLVEGDCDVRLFRRLTNSNSCLIRGCLNRANVIGIVTRLDASGFVGHLGVIDDDLGSLLNERLDSNNIVVTDLTDIELIIFESDVFQRVLNEYGSADKITAIENLHSTSLREAVLRSARDIGTLRFLSRREQWNLKFRDMTFQFAQGSIFVDLQRQVEHLRGRTVGTSMPTAPVVIETFGQVQAQYDQLTQLACGHDVCEIVSHGLHRVFGRAHLALGSGRVAVEEVFRAAFTRANFEATNLFAQIFAWELQNPPYHVVS